MTVTLRLGPDWEESQSGAARIMLPHLSVAFTATPYDSVDPPCVSTLIVKTPPESKSGRLTDNTTFSYSVENGSFG